MSWTWENFVLCVNHLFFYWRGAYCAVPFYPSDYPIHLPSEINRRASSTFAEFLTRRASPRRTFTRRALTRPASLDEYYLFITLSRWVLTRRDSLACPSCRVHPSLSSSIDLYNQPIVENTTSKIPYTTIFWGVDVPRDITSGTISSRILQSRVLRSKSQVFMPGPLTPTAVATAWCDGQRRLLRLKVHFAAKLVAADC